MLYREMIAVCCQIHTKHINTVCLFCTSLKFWCSRNHLLKQFQYVDVTNEILPSVDV